MVAIHAVAELITIVIVVITKLVIFWVLLLTMTIVPMVIIGRVTAHAKRAKPIVKNVLALQLVLLVLMAFI